MANIYPALKVQVPDVSPLTNVLGNAPTQIAEQKRKNLLTDLAVEKAGMQRDKFQFDLERASREDQMKVFEWMGDLGLTAGDDQEKIAKGLETVQRMFPNIPVDMDDWLLARDRRRGQIATQMKLKQGVKKPLSTAGKIKSDISSGYLSESEGTAALDAANKTVDDKVIIRMREKEELKTIGDYRKRANNARGLLSDIAELRNMRKGVGYEGGLMPKSQAAVRGFFGAGEGQALESKATEIQLRFTERTKGAISEKEMELFGRATPGLSMTDTGAKRVLDGWEAGALRTRERHKFFLAWKAKNKTLEGAHDAWDMYVDENPLIKEDAKNGFKVDRTNLRNWRSYLDPSKLRGSAGFGGMSDDEILGKLGVPR